MGGGFSVQMVFIFIDNAPGGNKEALPGLNVTFAEGNEWDKLIILSPQPSGRVQHRDRAEGGRDAVRDHRPRPRQGRRPHHLGLHRPRQARRRRPVQWGYQVVIQSNEGFPQGNDLLTRKVNEYEGQHRFGGGTDTDCDPHAVDILASDAEGQKAMLKYECNPDGTAKQGAVLKMVRKS